MPLEKKSGLTFYRRGHDPGIHVRDEAGGHHVVRQGAGGRYRATALTSSLPWYNRINWRNRGRFTRGIGPDLPALFANAGLGELLSSGPQPLPARRRNAARVPGQGMVQAMAALFDPHNPNPGVMSASDYAQRLGIQGRFEWCHLVAHSLAGGDGPANVVAGTAFNNSEQLIIENLLAGYGDEGCFGIEVVARLLNTGLGRHMGLAIRYAVNGPQGSRTMYLNCQVQNQPTAIHLNVLMQRLARWLNHSLAASAIVHITPTELQDVLTDCPQFAEPPPASRKRTDGLDPLPTPLAKKSKRKR